MPNNWKTYKLSDALEIKYGKDHKKVEDGDIPIYGTGGIMRYGNQYLYDDESILIPRKGSLNNIYYIKKPFWTVDTLFWSKINKDIAFPKYLYYNLKILDFADMDVGSAVPSLTSSLLKEIEIQLPQLQEQKAIANILSAIDDKIENNLAINKTLEDMAMALYKHWFVDFGPFQEGAFVESELGLIPEGWEVKRLDEIIEIKRGGSPRPIKDFIADDGLHWLKISDATASNSPFLYTTKEFIKEEGLRKTILIKPGSIILSNSATPGLPKLIEFETCIHDGWLHFPKINRFNRYILYLLFLDIKEYLIQQGNGSVFTNLKTDILKSQLIKLPTIEIENEFSNQIIPWFEEIKNNTEENLNLVKLRDTMLSKLISGEVRLKEFKNVIANAVKQSHEV